MENELFDIHHYMKLFIGLFAMVDPIAASTSFIALAAGYSKGEQAKMAAAAAIAMLVVFMAFLVFGTAILDFFAISQGAFMTMGGVVLGFMGLEMIRAAPTQDGDAPQKEAQASWMSVAIVPLAVPLLAGPGAISTVVIIAGQDDHPGHRLVVGLVIAGVVLCSYVLLRASRLIARLLGQTGINVFNKVMGMIVLAIAIEFLFDGVAAHFPQLASGHG